MAGETITLAKAFRRFGFRAIPADERYGWLKDSIEDFKAHQPGSLPADFDPFVGETHVTKEGADMFVPVIRAAAAL